MSKTTLVTAFFDISNLDDSNLNSRPLSFYLENGKYTLSQPFPMIILTSKNLRQIIEKLRNEVCPNNQTFYIEKEITDFSLYTNCYDIVKKNREEIIDYKNHRNTPSYCIITNLKIYYMKLAFDCNYFNTSHFAWIDFGGGHVCKDTISTYLPEIVNNPSEKIKVCYIHYRSSDEMKNIKEFVHLGPCGIAGNFWTIKGTFVNKLFLSWNELFFKQLFEGVGHNDEQSITLVYNKYPEMFEIYNGDYKSVYSNYFFVKDDYHSIRWYFIQEAINKNSINIAKEAINRLLISESLGFLKINEKDKNYFLYINQIQ
jgi:hypothetical protein